LKNNKIIKRENQIKREIKSKEKDVEKSEGDDDSISCIMIDFCCCVYGGVYHKTTFFLFSLFFTQD